MDKIWLQPCSKLTIQHMTNVLFMCKLTPLTLTFIFSLLHQTHSLSLLRSPSLLWSGLLHLVLSLLFVGSPTSISSHHLHSPITLVMC